MSDKEIGSLHHVWDDRLAILDEFPNRGEVDRLGSPTTWNENIVWSITAQMERVAENHAIANHFTGWKLDVALIDKNPVAFGRELRHVKLRNHNPVLGEFHELFMVQTLGIDNDPRSVDYSGIFFIGKTNFIRPEIAIGPTCLQLPNRRGIDVEFTINTKNILANRQCSHAVGIVGNASQFGALSGEEGLPPRRATLSRVFCGPIDQFGGVLVRSHEENFILSVQIHNWVLDTRADGRQEKVQNTVNVLFKSNAGLVLVIHIKQDHTLGSAFRNVLVLALLRIGQVVVLIEHRACVDAVGFLVAALDDTDTATGNIPEAKMESTELGADHKEHSIEALGVLMFWQEIRVESEAQGHLGWRKEVSLEDGGIEDTERRHDHFIVLIGGGARDQLLQFLSIQDFVNLEPHVTQSGEEIIVGRAACLHIMGVGKIQIELVDELRVSVDDLEDVIGREGLGTQPLLDFRQQFSVNTVV